METHTRADVAPHLRSSQVQCVNALGQMVDDPERIIRAFGPILDIASVRDLGEIDEAEAGRLLTFEFTGRSDYFGEARGAAASPPASTPPSPTPPQAGSGERGLALVEWKFTEQYRSADPKAEAKLAERRRRYESALKQPDGPIELSGLDAVAPLFHEPLYQLVRQQLLANALRRDADVPAEVVRVVHVSARANAGYQRSYVHPDLRGRGEAVSEVWRSLLRTPDTFVEVDSATFLDPDVTSEHYAARYRIAE